MKPESNRPISIEDLLRLKRAERPPAEFWSQFDRELRAKQLAALVAKRPWWQTIPRLWPVTLSRYRLVLGTSAVLAIGFVSLRQYQVAPAPSSGSEETVASAPADVPVKVAAASSPRASEAEISIDTTSPVTVAAVQPDVVASAATTLTVETPAPGELSRMIPLGGASMVDREAEPQSPSARYIAANLAAVQAAEPVAARNLLGAAHGFETRAMPARAAVEPLQQMTPPSEMRRSRLLTAMVSTASLETSARTTERAASRIDEERLYDQIHRFGARGDRVNVKF